MSERESTTMTMAKIIKPQDRMKNIIIIILRMLVIHKVSAATLLIIYIKFNIMYILHHFYYLYTISESRTIALADINLQKCNNLTHKKHEKQQHYP